MAELFQWCALHADVLSPSLHAAPSLSFSTASLSRVLLLVGNFPRRDLLAGGAWDPARCRSGGDAFHNAWRHASHGVGERDDPVA
jgi:hypothetical protein